MRRLGLGLVLSASAVLVHGCATLPDIQQNICGNGIIERERGEDCDGFGVQNGTSCRAPGLPGECRYECGGGKDGGGAVCPAGWGCGVDNTCRAANGEFTIGDEVLQGDAFRLKIADFDGDARNDVLMVGAGSLGVYYLDADRTLGKDVTFPLKPILPTVPSVSDLNRDGLTDLAVSASGFGLGVLLGRTDRSLVPTVQSTFPSPGKNTRVLALDVLTQEPGDEVLIAFDIMGGAAIAVVGEESKALFEIPFSLSLIAGPLRVGDFDLDASTSPCEEIALAVAGTGSAFVFTPCTADGLGFNLNAVPRQILLPDGALVTSGVLPADINGDGHLDLLIDTKSDPDPECFGTQVAYGVGDGTFHSDLANIPATGGDDRASCLKATLRFLATGDGPVVGTDGSFFPLAMGDLNGDAYADFVNKAGLFVYEELNGVPTYKQVAASGGAPWTEAAIADFNGNGKGDVIAGSSQSAGIDFFNGAGGGVFNLFKIPTQGAVAHFAVGDFDGDLVLDLALRERDNAGAVDAISVLFGRSIGAPEAPLRMGELSSIQDIVAGDNLLRFLFASGGDAGTLDGTSDLAVVSAPSGDVDETLAVLPGSTDRTLQSPYVLVVQGASAEEVASGAPLHQASGRFTAPDHEDLVAMAISADSTVHLWTIPVDASAKLLTATVGPALPEEYDWLFPSIATGDLDNDGLDELVIATSRGGFDASRTGALLITRADAQTKAFGELTPLLTTEPFSIEGPVEIVDVDGDGWKDIVVLSVADRSGFADVDAYGTDYLEVFWNNGAGGFSLDDRLVLDLGEGTEIYGFATLRTDGDDHREVAIVAEDGVYIARPDRLHATFAVDESPILLMEGTSAAAGDLDGNGLDDLAISNGSSVTLLFQGSPVAP